MLRSNFERILAFEFNEAVRSTCTTSFGLAHRTQLALDHDGAGEHPDEAEECEREVDLQRGDRESEACDDPEGRPAHRLHRMAIQPGLRDVLGEVLVGLELLLELAKDSLFVFG